VPEMTFGEREGAAHQSRHALAQGAVESLDVVGFSLLFAPGVVLFWWNDLGVGSPKVREAGACFVRIRNFVPQLAKRDVVARARHPGYDLTGSAAQRQPNPHLLALAKHKGPHLVQFQHLALLSRKQRVMQVADATRCLFLQHQGVFFSSRAVMVSRLILNVRAALRKLIRSPRAAKTIACFSAEAPRGLASGVLRLPHPRHRTLGTARAACQQG
jgi:hypothetical protein